MASTPSQYITELPEVRYNTQGDVKNMQNWARLTYSAVQGSDYNVLYGNFVKSFGVHSQPEHCLKDPLGVSYDEETERWIVADTGNNRIRLYHNESVAGDVIEGSLKMPSAVAVCEPGKSLAVLDNTGIRLFDYRNEQFLAAVKLNGRYRGLGCTARGDFVTVRNQYNGGTVEIYAHDKENTLLSSFPYYAPQPPQGGRFIRPNPSFVDVSMDRIVITDLAVNAFTIFKLNEASMWSTIPKYQVEQSVIQKQLPGRSSGRFEFISGAKFDADGEILIADAGTERLQLFDKKGNFKHEVKFSDSFAYPSGIAVNSHHELLVADRKRNMCKLYKLTGKIAINTSIKPSYFGNAPRRFSGERSGFIGRNRNY